MPTPDQYLENSPEYRTLHPEDFPDETSIENKFDWQAIRMLCIEAVPKHRAYGMLFPEYKKNRERLLDEDTTEKRRLSFYFPKIDAAVGKTYAAEFGCSYHRFMLLIIELGIIKFQHDYQDNYSTMKRIHKNARQMIDSNGDLGLCKFEQFAQQGIYLGTASGPKDNRKHFAPNVPEWLYNAISEISEYMGVCMSDMIYLCYCIGMTSAIPFELKSCVIEKRSKEVIASFEMQFRSLVQVVKIIETMEVETE